MVMNAGLPRKLSAENSRRKGLAAVASAPWPTFAIPRSTESKNMNDAVL